MARKPLTIIDLYSSDLPFATELRRLLQRLPDQINGDGLKSIMLTSAMLSEGKSTICSFLSVAAAIQQKKRVLLVDADLRRPTIHKLFGMPRQDGLEEILKEERNASDLIRHTTLENLDVITAGRPTSHPSEVFDADAIGQFVDEQKFNYDLIIVDCAPVLPVSDPMLLASYIDGILLIVKAGATQKEVVKRAVEILDSNHSHLLGVVLNNMNNSLPFYYDYKYYGYEQTEKPKASPKVSRRSKNSRNNNQSVRSRSKRLPTDSAVK